jgi:hypothetical protein
MSTQSVDQKPLKFKMAFDQLAKAAKSFNQLKNDKMA